MAYDENQLYASQDGPGAVLRAAAKIVRTISLASDATTPTLSRLTPLAFNTSTNLWVVWDQDGDNGTNVIGAFLWPDEATLHATGEVLAPAMFAGEIYFDDIPIVSDNYSEAQLRTALRTGARPKGFNIQGITQFR